MSHLGRRTGPSPCVGLIVMSVACSAVQVRPHVTGLEEGGEVGGTSVRYSARCLKCQVTYESPDGAEREEVTGSWSRAYSGRDVPSPLLSLCRTGSDTHLEGRISVGGRVASNSLEMGAGDSTACITVTAP